MLRTNSLRFRLLAIAASWGFIGLTAGALLLTSTYQQLAIASLDHQLVADLDTIILKGDLDCRGQFILPELQNATQYFRAFSGSYWQVSPVGAKVALKSSDVMRSRSLWDKLLPVSSNTKTSVIVKASAEGPIGQNLRYIERIVSISRKDPADAEAPDCVKGKVFRITVAGALNDIEAEISKLNTTLFLSVIVLGIIMTGAMAWFLRSGLAPLEQIPKSLSAIRQGRADKLEGNFPIEIQPLADELNALVKHNSEVVARARTHVGNLAHFLKTPLSVLANEAKGTSGPLSEAVNKQVQVMRRQVDHYLARARTVASASTIGARCDVAPVLADLTRALSKIYDAQGIAVEGQCADGLVFRGDRADLEEMTGNLLDNACKWAESKVVVNATPAAAGRLRIQVTDDGPGLSDEQKRRVLERGERLDESKPGSGLGLGIVKEIASLYGGTFHLGRSEAGGLLVELDLPAAEKATS